MRVILREFYPPVNPGRFNALIEAGVKVDGIYADQASGKRDTRPGLDACLKALRKDDVLVVWKLDRLGCDLKHLVTIVQGLTDREIGLRSLQPRGAIDNHEFGPFQAAGVKIFEELAPGGSALPPIFLMESSTF